ncbi:unnamed protein product, partial [Meganyctiphanes norvegica]
MWTVIRALSGKNVTSKKIVLGLIEQTSDPVEIAKAFGTHFSQVSSTGNYNPAFIRHKIDVEQNIIVFPHDNGKYYNSIFTMKELTHAIKNTSNTSPGPDDVHYEMLRNLPHLQQIHLLNFINFIWTSHVFPTQWREAIILPFLKPNKPAQAVASYRPIALTSCVCKTMERMVLPRLSLALEEQNFVKPYQSGFKRLHSTMDCLVRLESAIQDTFLNREYMIAVFLDIEKAYDMLWRYSIHKALSRLKLVGNLPKFIINFLSNRFIRVRIGTHISEAFLVENGIPQGSVLSCTLFLIAINSIFEEAVDVVKSLFCDDGLFWATGATVDAAR